jgi:hypothetical protein
VKRSILRCIALVERSIAAQEWLEHGKLSPVRFIFLCCYDRERPIWAGCSMSTFHRRHLYSCLYTASWRGRLVNMCYPPLSGPTHTHTRTRVHTSTPRFSLTNAFCRIDPDHVFLHHTITVPPLNNPHQSQHPTERGSLAKTSCCMHAEVSPTGGGLFGGWLHEEPKPDY